MYRKIMCGEHVLRQCSVISVLPGKLSSEGLWVQGSTSGVRALKRHAVLMVVSGYTQTVTWEVRILI